ncbi:reverse transcriptase domain-containing protein [Tanacetum coccineum]
MSIRPHTLPSPSTEACIAEFAAALPSSSLPPSVSPPPENIKQNNETMTTINQGMSFTEVEQIIAQQVANIIETIGIYETKTSMARESMNQVKQQEVLRAKQRPLVVKQKAKVTCYECGMLGHYKSNCPMCKFQNRVNKYWKEKALGDSSVVANNVDV